MLDAGPGTVSALQHHIEIGDLTAVVLSHHHPDHWTDLGVLRTAWRWALGRDHLSVYATPDTCLIGEQMFAGETTTTIDWHRVADGDEVPIGDLRLRFARTDHYVETLAVRVDHGTGAFAYSADTGPAWEWSALGDGLDTVLCEATLLAAERADADSVVLHLTADEAGRLARDAGITRLLLTHLPPGADPDAHRAEAEAAFGAPVEVVTQHATYEL
jgi:ribonuclease BN (tRNA processing enzyme)